MQAYYYNATKTIPASLCIMAAFKNILLDIPVRNKREARKLAAYYNAEPWNF